MAHIISIAETNAALSQFANQFSPEIKQVFRTGLEFENMGSLIPFRSCDNSYTAVNVNHSDVLQPYQPRFTPNNTETWDAVTSTLRPIKMDLEYSEEQLMQFFDQWRFDWAEAGKDPMEWSYPKYILDQVIAPKFQEELNNVAYNGVFVEPAPGVAGASLESQDGFKVRIESAITAGDLVPVASGSYTSSDIRSKLETWMMTMPVSVRSKGGTVLMSDTHAREYYYDYRGDFNTTTLSWLQENGGMKIDGFNVVVKPIAAMEGSNRWIFLPANEPNMIVGTRRGYPTYPQFIFQPDLYVLKCKAVFYRFFGFEYWSKLYVNDQA